MPLLSWHPAATSAEIDLLAERIQSTPKVAPAPAHTKLGLVDMLLQVALGAVPGLDLLPELGAKLPNPSVNDLGISNEAPLSMHLLYVPVRKLIATVTAYRQQDDLARQAKRLERIAPDHRPLLSFRQHPV